MGHAVAPRFNSLAAFRVGSGAHPLPPKLDVHPGTPGTLDYAIVRAVLAHVPHTPE